MIIKLKYYALMFFGFFAFNVLMLRANPPKANNLLAFAGFYAFSDGLDSYRRRTEAMKSNRLARS